MERQDSNPEHSARGRMIQGTTKFKVRGLEETGIYQVPLYKASRDNVSQFGHIVDNFEKAEVEIVTWPQSGWRPILEGTGNEGGITEGRFDMVWKGDTIHTYNHAVERGYITGWSTDPGKARSDQSTTNRDYVFVFEANYHPDGGQIFYPREGKPFVALLALPGDDIRPQDFVAFYFDGSKGLCINPGIWHAPVFPVEDKTTFDDRQGKVHACVVCNFVTEFGVYLKVPLNSGLIQD